MPFGFSISEQRLTHLFIFLLVGLSTLMTPYLNIIPMPVLYGVFLFMGTSALGEISFFNRMRIILIPVKYQPDYDYLRQVTFITIFNILTFFYDASSFDNHWKIKFLWHFCDFLTRYIWSDSFLDILYGRFFFIYLILQFEGFWT